MKKALIAAAALLVSVAVYGQGQVQFNTHIDTIATRVFNPDGITPATAGFGELDIVNADGSLTAMVPDVAAAFKTSANGAGYINAGLATAPINAAFGDGAVVTLRLRAWQGGAGSTYDTAVVKGQSLDLAGVVLHAGNVPPGELLGTAGATMASFTMVPEPTTLALGALGLGALLIRRRK